MFRIKGQVQTSHLSNLQAYRPKSLFRDQVIPILSFYRIQNQILSRQGRSNTSILPNTKLKRLTNHVSHQGTSSNIPFIKLVGIQSKISFLRQGSIQYFYFTEYKTKQVHVSCFASRDIEGQVKPPYLSNMKPYRLKSCFRDKGHPYTFYLPNLNPSWLKYYATHQRTSRNM